MGIQFLLFVCLLTYCVPLATSLREKLLFSNATTIKEFDFDTHNVTELVGTGGSVVLAMDYDYKNGYVYVLRHNFDDIVRFPYPSKNITLQTVVQTDRSPTGIAVDSANDHIYWVDYYSNKLSRCNLDGTNIKTVISLNIPYVLRLDVTNRSMYIVEYSIGILKSRFNLDEKKTIVSFTQPYVTCMDIDTDEQRLYWMYYNGDMKSAKDDGSDVKTIMSTYYAFTCYALGVFGSHVYYAYYNQLFMVTKIPGSTPTLLHTDTADYIYSIFVFNSSVVT